MLGVSAKTLRFACAGLAASASLAFAEPINEAYGLCFSQPADREQVKAALIARGWTQADPKAGSSIAQQLALAIINEKAPDVFFGDRIALLPSVAEAMDLNKADSVFLINETEHGRDIVQISTTESSVFVTSRCLFAGQRSNNPNETKKLDDVFAQRFPNSPAWILQIPWSPNVPAAASAEVKSTNISSEAREGFLSSIVLADTAFDALISYSKEK